MLKRLSQLCTLIGVSVLLSGCLFGKHGYIHDRQQDYLQSQSEPGLKIPAEVKAAKITPALPITPGPDFHKAGVPSLVPPGHDNQEIKTVTTPVSTEKLTVTMGQGAAGFPVLKLSGSYKENWHALTAALTSLGYQVIGSDQKTGVIEFMASAQGDASSEIYQLKIAEGTHGSMVSVLDQTGDDLAQKPAKVMLGKLLTKLGR